MKEETLLTTVGRHPAANHGIVNPPVYHASTILSESMAERRARRAMRWEKGVYSYGLHGTPTHEALEDGIAALEGGDRAVVVGSGLAALNIAFLAFVKAGDHVLVADTAYGPVRHFCDSFLSRFGVSTTYYDPAIGAGIAALIQDNTRVIYTESPGSLTFEVQDIPAIAEAAHARGVRVVMDNTWSAGIYFKPFAHGVDVSVQAVTKYIGGHSDLMMGSLTTTNELWHEVRNAAGQMGAASGPDDVYLALRGLRSLKSRMPRHFETGVKLAEYLTTRPEVHRVIHPALPGDRGHALWKRDFTGASGLFAFVLTGYPQAAVDSFVDGMSLFGLGASWGGFESLIVPAELGTIRTAVKWAEPGPTIRLHAGLEHPDDLIADLQAGFKRLAGTA